MRGWTRLAERGEGANVRRWKQVGQQSPHASPLSRFILLPRTLPRVCRRCPFLAHKLRAENANCISSSLSLSLFLSLQNNYTLTFPRLSFPLLFRPNIIIALASPPRYALLANAALSTPIPPHITNRAKQVGEGSKRRILARFGEGGWKGKRERE